MRETPTTKETIMKYGHTTGTKRETKNASNWYAAIEAEHIARIEAMEAQAEVARLAQIVGDAVTALPEAATRITKAAALAQHHEVWPLTSGSFLVGAQSDTTTAYLVRRGPWTCECADYTYRAATCKHVIAAQITVRMGDVYRPNYELPQAA